MRQRTRVLLLLVSFCAFVVVGRIVTGQWFRLPSGDEGIWLQSALLLVVLGSLLLEPYYARPADAAANATAALVTLFALSDPGRFMWWSGIVAYCIVTLALALASMALWDPMGLDRGRRYHASRLCYDISTRLGAAKWLFSLIFVLAVLSYYETPSVEFLALMLFWTAVLLLRPVRLPRVLESVLGLLGREKDTVIGKVEATETPRLAVARLSRPDAAELLDLVVVEASDGNPIAGAGLVLDLQYMPDAVRAKVLMLSPFRAVEGRDSGSDGEWRTSGAVLTRPTPADTAKEQVRDNPIWARRERLVGLVSENSRIAEIRIDLRSTIALEQGNLVCTDVGSDDVVYQIIEGSTRSDALGSASRDGYITATARQVGVWKQVDNRFESFPWVPELQSPVYAVDPSHHTAVPARAGEWPHCQIGVLPGGNYPALVDLNHLVTHHAAILGITGSGKSWLALEIITRLVRGSVKTLCLDPLGEYDGYLSGANPAKVATVEELDDFLNSEQELLALAEYSRQEGFPKRTSQYVDAILRWAADQPLGDPSQGMTATLCVVFDEAHTLIPEWTSVVDERDKRFVNMTCHTILQGRRYGVGAIVITQRTANVTKTILNQCNTIFALQCFDQTGYDFLKNYMGQEYVEALATLPSQHGVLVGRASRAAVPLIVSLPHRDTPLVPTACECSPVAHDDEIPF